jgi:peptide/nickel transport system permease protein
MWFYPLSLMGVSMVMIGVNFLVKGTFIDRTVGVLCALVPTVVTGIVATAAAHEAHQILAHPLLSGEIALFAYLGFALAVFISGLRVETFWTLQLPVLREKSSLTRKRIFQILRQMLRNPMGLIGSIILIFFVVIAALGPYIAPYEVDMTINGEFNPYELPSSEHWMGVDNLGHDVFSELLYGARTSIVVGIVAAAISSVLGAAIGLYSGYVGGWKDEVIMRLNDIVLSIPWLVLMIIIAAFMGSIDLWGIILVIGLTGWSGTARLVRAQVLSLRERQYIERARAIGSDDVHIINRHILPNAFPLVFANTILTVAVSILSEATLSFLGLRPQGTVTWGTMLSYAQAANAFSLGLHWWIVAPGLCIVVVVLGFTLLGYALDDVMNPKLRKR